jgi:hypothetical protein
MSSISTAFDAAILADAVYLNFALAPGAVLSGIPLRTALLETDRLTAAQAQYISTHYDLVAFEPAGS